MAMPDSTVEYKDIPGFPGYRVGNDGSVWSCWRNKSRGYGRGTMAVMSHMHWRTLKQMKKPHGYLEVALRRDKKYTYFLVHRLVLENFVGPCPADGQECRHRDGNRLNNVASNLQWGTRRENILDKFAHGTALIGEACNLSRLTADIVRAMRAKYAAGSVTQTELANEYGVTQANVSEIILRKTWKHIE